MNNLQSTNIEPYLESNPGELKTTRAKVACVMLISAMIAKWAPEDAVRHRLPEPFDYFDHAGNFAWSLVVSGCASYTVQEEMASKSNCKPSTIKRLGLAAGTLVCAAANFLTETKYGGGLMQTHGADPIDAYYGTAAGIIGSSLIGLRSKQPDS